MSAPPRPPWHPFPLVELCVALGLALLVAGYVSNEPALLVAGLLLGALAGLETALREHLSGHRSHAAVLAGVPAVVVVGVLALLVGSRGLAFFGGAAAFLAVFLALRAGRPRRR